MSEQPHFHYEIEETEDASKWHTTTIKCHGKLVSATAAQVKDLVKPMIERGGRIILDFGDLEYIDSSGLGALVGLKVTAINQGLCKLELVNLTPRVRELLSLTNLMQLFSK